MLIAAAKRGDRDSFTELLTAHMDTLRAVVYRIIGHPDEAADLVQDTQLKAFSKLASFRGDAGFGTWLISIATRTCLDHLRKQTRWRAYSQKYAEQECAGRPELRQEVLNTLADPAFSFDVKEHIAFCFTCVGRSLPPMQEAALILREVLRYSNREAAKILDITESVLRRHLADARRSMIKTFEGLCALVNKQGVCYQCSGFRNSTPRDRRGPEVQPIVAEHAERRTGEQLTDEQARYRVRLRVVQDTPFAGGVSDLLHTLIFNRIRDIERRAATAQ